MKHNVSWTLAWFTLQILNQLEVLDSIWISKKKRVWFHTMEKSNPTHAFFFGGDVLVYILDIGYPNSYSDNTSEHMWNVKKSDSLPHASYTFGTTKNGNLMEPIGRWRSNNLRGYVPRTDGGGKSGGLESHQNAEFQPWLLGNLCPGHPKWLFSKGIPQKITLIQVLGMVVICPECLVGHLPSPVYQILENWHFF